MVCVMTNECKAFISNITIFVEIRYSLIVSFSKYTIIVFFITIYECYIKIPILTYYSW